MSWEATKITCKCGSTIESRWTSELNDWQKRHDVCLQPITLAPNEVFTPFKKEWQNLTNEEFAYCFNLGSPYAIAEEVESKLREKNA